VLPGEESACWGHPALPAAAESQNRSYGAEFPRFVAKETEVWRCGVTCLRSHHNKNSVLHGPGKVARVCNFSYLAEIWRITVPGQFRQRKFVRPGLNGKKLGVVVNTYYSSDSRRCKIVESQSRLACGK
jgi:hypothetical protein